jgi:hypothetical protein
MILVLNPLKNAFLNPEECVDGNSKWIYGVNVLTSS